MGAVMQGEPVGICERMGGLVIYLIENEENVLKQAGTLSSTWLRGMEGNMTYKAEELR